MTDTSEHWQSVYQSKAATDVSWFESVPETSLTLVQSVSDSSCSVIDVGAGAAYLVDNLRRIGYHDLVALDISATALDKVRTRFEADPEPPTFVVADITSWSPDRRFDVWHDRAVFHFMVTKEMRDGYKRAINAALSPGAHAIVATFALDGPEQCSGITVSRYSEVNLAAEFADNFGLVNSAQSSHTTPWDSEQRFNWVVLRKK